MDTILDNHVPGQLPAEVRARFDELYAKYGSGQGDQQKCYILDLEMGGEETKPVADENWAFKRAIMEQDYAIANGWVEGIFA